MKKKLLKGVFIDTTKQNNEIKKDTMKDDLHSMYEKLNCNMVEIINAEINGIRVDLIFNEEGKLKPEKSMEYAVVLIHDMELCDVIIGNTFICKGNDLNGELESLSNEEIDLILKRKYEINLDNDTTRNVIVARY